MNIVDYYTDNYTYIMLLYTVMCVCASTVEIMPLVTYLVHSMHQRYCILTVLVCHMYIIIIMSIKIHLYNTLLLKNILLS